VRISGDVARALCRTRTGDPFLTMEGPGARGCDTLLPRWHERPALERDFVAHHVGLASITEQTNGRVMDAQSNSNRRLVPVHLTVPKRLI
jgi:hypothetical protein